MLSFSLGCREPRWCHIHVTACRKSRLSLHSPTALCRLLMSNTVVLLLLGRSMYSWESFGALAINATSKSVSVPTTTVGLSNTFSADDMILLVGHLFQHSSGDGYETTFVLHIAQEICLWSCSRHASIHQDACWEFLWCSPGMFYLFCGELLVIHQEKWQISWAIQDAYDPVEELLGTHYNLLLVYNNAAGHGC